MHFSALPIVATLTKKMLTGDTIEHFYL